MTRETIDVGVEPTMRPAWRGFLRGLVVSLGVAVTLASALTFRLEDWPIYVVFVLLSVVLFLPFVEVMPGLTMPMPGLAVTIGFLYVVGPPIIVLRNLAPPILIQLFAWVAPARWRRRLPDSSRLMHGRIFFRQTFGAGYPEAPNWLPERSAVAADWANFALGLAVRWGVVSLLVPDGRAIAHPGAMLVAELAGYASWAVLATLPIYSFSPISFLRFHPAASQARLRPVAQDLGLIVILALTPFVFLIAYGYQAHGLAGATVWSLASLGLHYMLQRLSERRMTLEEQNRRLEALNRELEHRERLSAIGKMSSVISHQILQQLGVIGLYADLIRNADDPGEPDAKLAQARVNAQAIEGALRSVNGVLSDLLVFSKDLRLNLYQHPLRALLEECVETCRTEATERGAVALRLDCPVEVTVTLDKLKMKQAVLNVLRNAIQASPLAGEVAVQAAVRDGHAEIAVSDRGPGVPQAECETIFTPFFTTREQGTGLGLAIAREFTDAHGGKLWVEERSDGQGARFMFRVPLAGPIEGRSDSSEVIPSAEISPS